MEIDLTDFEMYLNAQEHSPRTTQGYLRDMHLFAVWFEQTNGEPLNPKSLTRIDAREYRQHLLTVVGAKPATINRRLAALRSYSDWARASGQVDYSLVNGVKNVEEQKHAPKWLDKKDQDQLLREMDKNLNAARTAPAQRQAVRDKAIVFLLIYSGLRVSELVGLDQSDVVITDRKGTVWVRMGKGGKQRTVPLNKPARDVLDAWQEQRPSTDERAYFLNKNNGRLTARSIQEMLGELSRRAKVDATPHTLRHTFAKNLINAGVSLEKVSALMGHSKLETTTIYVTPSQNDLERAVDLLGE
ncbi:MAG TPA: tyrosine-type recombinase/integrase [Anaerolineales bacterium]|nr:tyrosine-type recombinase/integrase [Anaerolineales bacterium]